MYRRLAKFVPVPRRPPWLALAADEEVRGLRARREAGTLRLWLTFATGHQRLVDLDVSSDSIRRRVARAGAPWVDCDAELAGRWAPAVAAFSERLAWHQSVMGEPRASTGYEPDLRARTMARLFRALRGEGEAPTKQERIDAGLDEPSLDLGAYSAVLRGDWRALFELADGPTDGTPRWVRPMVLAVSGDTAALRRHIDESGSADPGSGALGVLEGLALKDMHCVRAAYDAMRGAFPYYEPSERADFYVPFATLAEEIEGEALAIRCLVGAIQGRRGDDRLMLRAMNGLLRHGAFSEVAGLLAERAAVEPPHYDVFVMSARLALACGQVLEARAWVARALALVPDGVEALRSDAICDALAGQRERALEGLLRIVSPIDSETQTWIAELSIGLGDVETATHYLNLGKARAQTVVHSLVQTLIEGQLNSPNARAFLEFVGAEPSREYEAIPGVLRRLQGNRGETLTQTPTAEPAAPKELERVFVPENDWVRASRNAAANLLRTLRFRSVEALHEDFEALTREYPESPHPWCYWGELRLWLGDLDEAARYFRMPSARDARWAYVGRAAVHVHRGEFEAALAEFADVGRDYTPIPGATTHVYEGELLRTRGDHAAALVEFDTALAAKPGRLSARLNRALCLLALGRDDEAAVVAVDLETRFPRLLWDVARSLEMSWPTAPADFRVVAERALELMRGNRSSHTITYFDGEGRLRIVEDATAWSAFAERRRGIVERAVVNRFMA